MKIKNLFSVTKNKLNNQLHFQLRRKVLKKSGMEIEDLMDINLVPKPRTKYFKGGK